MEMLIKNISFDSDFGNSDFRKKINSIIHNPAHIPKEMDDNAIEKLTEMI
jgi:hypothetical protein